MSNKLFESELKIMEVLWNEGPVTAKHIAEKMMSLVGWSKSTSYTLIKRCIAKGAIQRQNPNFICIALVDKNEICKLEANELINKFYSGMPDQLIACVLKENSKLKNEDIDMLMNLINKIEEKNS